MLVLLAVFTYTVEVAASSVITCGEYFLLGFDVFIYLLCPLLTNNRGHRCVGVLYCLQRSGAGKCINTVVLASVIL